MTAPPARRHAAAPSFGTHEPVTRYGRRLGAVVDVMGAWTPVCVHKECLRRLAAHDDRQKAREALRHHWGARHAGGAR